MSLLKPAVSLLAMEYKRGKDLLMNIFACWTSISPQSPCLELSYPMIVFFTLINFAEMAVCKHGLR